MYSICVIPGDGIGQEVVPSAQRVLEATGVSFKFIPAQAGWKTFQEQGKSVPDETLTKVREADATLAGAFTSPKGSVEGFFSAIRYLRRELELFANLRPAKSRPVEDSLPNVDIMTVRENTEGLYVTQERRYGDVAIADAVVTRQASERITEVAIMQAKARQKKLAIIHKANVLPVTTGFFLEIARELTSQHPDIDSYDLIVDAAAMMLVKYPESFDVLVTTNLFGDILSDLIAGLVGGLGIVPSANIGKEHAIFESVHGSAPDIAGKGISNPTATILSSAMMLEYLGEAELASALDAAVNRVLSSGLLTPDLGGSATTDEFTDTVISELS